MGGEYASAGARLGWQNRGQARLTTKSLKIKMLGTMFAQALSPPPAHNLIKPDLFQKNHTLQLRGQPSQLDKT
jgi:hypothetical protein